MDVEQRRDGVAIGRRLTAPHSVEVVGVLLAVAAVAGTIVRSAGQNGAFVLVLCLLALATTLPLAVLPAASGAAVITVALAVSFTPFQTVTLPGVAAQLLALFLVGRGGRQLLAGLLTMPFLVLALTGSAETWTRILAVLLAALGPLVAWAGAAQLHRTQARQERDARQALDGTLLESAVRDERTRIARELHDVVAHHLSMIAVQAEAARLSTPGMPAAGARRLAAIGDTSRAALTEMRRLLGVLREDTSIDRAAAPPAERQPQPGLRQLNDLLDQAREVTGAGTRLILCGVPNELDPGVELAAFRIVQEALSNARRHAPGSAVDVELHYADDALRLRVRDNGPGPAPAPQHGGHGLLGMQERVAAVGGRLATGPAPGGGFLVETWLPVGSDAAG